VRLFDRAFRASNTTAPISMLDWQRMFKPGAQFTYNGQLHQAFKLAAGSSGGNSVVFACAATRSLLLSEARFLFQALRKGRPAELFSTPDVQILEQPWPGATTGELIAQADLDVTEHGNSYWVREGDALYRWEPQYVRILTQAVYGQMITPDMVGEKIALYVYTKDPQRPVFKLPDEIVHHKPYPDPCNRFLGQSWLSACLPDVTTDNLITNHKQAALGQGANLGYVVSFDPQVEKDEFEYFTHYFRENYTGPENAGKTLLLGGGADVKTVGQTFENLALKAITDSGEARVAACAGVPPIIAGLIPGLDASTYSNFNQARRLFADGTLRPLWRAFASALSSVIAVPSGSRLWYDDRDIPFLRDDAAETAATQQAEMSTIAAGTMAGFEPDSIVAALMANDWSLLKHTGLPSVQVQANVKTPPPSATGSSGRGF
jgi:phage portal protein BeeE